MTGPTAETTGTSASSGAGTPGSSGTGASAASGRPCGPRLRGRPRSAEADAAIIEAVLRLIEDGDTITGLSMERIAREAGVGKATVYRRWPGKEALMIDVLRSLEEPVPEAGGGPVRDDLVLAVELVRRRGLAKRNSALLRTVIAQMQAHPTLWREYRDKVIAVRRELVRNILRRGLATGEISPDYDVELLEDLFTGPMLARAILHEWQPLPEGLAERIVDAVLEGVGRRP